MIIRNEVKFIAPYSKLINFINNFGFKKIFETRKVNSIYYDDVELSYFSASEEGTVPRKKVRFRWYGDKFKGYGNLEIKQTYDLHRSKDKISLKSITNLKNIEFDVNKQSNKILNPVLKVCYIRDYFYCKNKRINITLDKNIYYYKLNKYYDEISMVKDHNSILEIKFEKNQDHYHYSGYLNNYRVRNSKYCEAIKKLNIFNHIV